MYYASCVWITEDLLIWHKEICVFLSAVYPRYITQYPVCPGPPGFPPSLIHPPPIAPPDISHFKVYIGKIAPTVDYNFVISLLQVCGVVKSWKPVRNPLDGTRTGFGFCEFESAEGCLRARRLLNKLSVDGQELVLSVDQATINVPFKYSAADKDAMEKIHSMIEERMKNKLPRSPTPAVQVSACTVDDNGNDDARSELEERKIRRQCEKEEHLGGRKAVGYQGKKDREVTAAGKSSLRIDAAPSMHVPMERESTVEHKRKIQHMKRGGFRKSNGEEKGRERKTVGSEGWKDREGTAAGKSSLQIDEESLMHVCMERESAVEHERKNQHRKRDGFRKSNVEEKGREKKTVGSEGRKDREVAAAGMSSLQIDVVPSMHVPMERESAGDGFPKSNGEENRIVFVPGLISDKQNISAGEKVGFELQATSNSVDKKTLDAKHLHATVPKMIEERMKSKLSGSPTPAVQVSACIVDEKGDDDTGRSSLEERKIRRQCEEEEPLGERKAVGPKGWKDREVTTAGMSSLQVDAAPSMHVPRECEYAVEHERKSQDRERDGFLTSNSEEKRIVFVPGLVSDKQNASAGEKVVLELQATSKSRDKKPLDAKQLLATVPKMKGELFAHDVNWAIYDKYGLHETMRPWISKKATEVFGEELAEFVDYVVASTKEHLSALRMLELLESLLDDDAENFVVLMWRKLIFEIKKVEEGFV